jgi:hypothetical protein
MAKTEYGVPMFLIAKAYGVLLDRNDKEVSDRVPGSLWWWCEGPSKHGLDFSPDETDGHGSVEMIVYKKKFAYTLGTFIDGHLICRDSLVGPGFPGQTITVLWDRIFAHMA